jgi:hypothetical protein
MEREAETEWTNRDSHESHGRESISPLNVMYDSVNTTTAMSGVFSPLLRASVISFQEDERGRGYRSRVTIGTREQATGAWPAPEITVVMSLRPVTDEWEIVTHHFPVFCYGKGGPSVSVLHRRSLDYPQTRLAYPNPSRWATASMMDQPARIYLL